MKKFLVMLCICLMALSICAFGANDVKVLLDDGYMNFTDENGNIVNPEITNSRTMVPLRKIFESLKANVDWDNDTRTVTATKNGRTVKLTINSDIAYIIENGQTETVYLDSAPYIVDGRTLIPLRFVSESFNCLVGWDNDTRTAIIINPESIANYALTEIQNKCTNFMDFANSLKASGKYSVTQIDINIPGLLQETELFSDSIRFNVINNKNKLYINFLENFIVTDTTEDYDIKNIFFELDLSEIVVNDDYESALENVSYNYLEKMKDFDITLDTYKEIKAVMGDFIDLLSNKYFKYDGKNVNWNFKMSDVEYIKDDLDDDEDLKFSINITLDEGLIKTSNIKIETPNGIVSIKTNTKYSNSEYKIPSSAEVNSMEDLIMTLAFMSAML